jgi:tetratricopeptide (TPR) repeat protein
VRAQTRHSLKEDRFRGATIVAAERTAHWTVEHKNTLIIAGIAIVVLLALGLGGWTYISRQDEKASLAFGQAVRTMETPLRPAGVPEQPGYPSFASAQERAAAAKKQFQAIVDSYPHTHTADMARYFLGVTSADLGDNAGAERYLSQAAALHNNDLAALAKLALASVYRKENKDAQAIDLYKQLSNKPTRTVGKVTAQLELASLYEAKQQSSEAKRIYEQIQKENPASEAASLASTKLAALK